MKKIILIAMMIGVIIVGSLNVFAADDSNTETTTPQNTSETVRQCNPDCPYAVANPDGTYTCGNSENGQCNCGLGCNGSGNCINGGQSGCNGNGYKNGNGNRFRGCRNR